MKWEYHYDESEDVETPKKKYDIEISDKPDDKTGLYLPKGARKFPIGFTSNG